MNATSDIVQKLWNLCHSSFQWHQAFYGMELVQDAHRLLLMNLMLYGIEGAVELGVCT